MGKKPYYNVDFYDDHAIFIIPKWAQKLINLGASNFIYMILCKLDYSETKW